jgi:hypothetical protein
MQEHLVLGRHSGGNHGGRKVIVGCIERGTLNWAELKSIMMPRTERSNMIRGVNIFGRGGISLVVRNVAFSFF